ncbi:MAG: monovalent cation/H+ antiporter subunit A [Alphaproteobacteria bacterium]|nr:MAG: monovalent cation/H+ antiporter subunit A [Alphaproteobacteria bacterium]
MPTSFLLLALIGLPFFGALLAAWLPTHARNAAATLASTVTIAGLVCLVLLHGATFDGARTDIAWLPSLGVNLVFRLDGLSWLFALLIVGIGALIVLYARYYMSAEDPVPRFYSFLLAFMGAMLGIVMSGNIIQLALFWEVTSLFSFLLIGYWHQNANAREGARMALTVTAAGGLCLLVGMLLLGQIAGGFDLDVVLGAGERIREHALYLPTLVLILIGAFTKSAQFPFHFWLPHAMAAPTPVSAYLHSATLVKAGVFLLILLWPVLSGTDAWYALVGSVGMATLLIGAFAAIYQHDLKGLLAYSTISHIGLITLLLGLGSPLAAVAAIFHTVNHATFKASLFMAAGIIDHETGTRDMRKLSGLVRFMPVTASLAMVAAAAMAGVPLLNGFLSKEMFLAEAIAQSSTRPFNYALPVLATLASAFSVLYSLRFIHTTFFGPPPTECPRTPAEPPQWMRFPIEILVLICLVVGIVPGLTIGPFLAAAVDSMLGPQAPNYSLRIWHGFSPALLLSMTALIAGALAYALFGKRINANSRGAPPILHRFQARRLFDGAMAGLVALARGLEQRLSTRWLQPQLRLLVLIPLAIALAVAFVAGGVPLSPQLQPVDPVFALMWVVGAACAIGAAYQAKYHRYVALVLMGGAGLVSCLTFIWLSAPDLALTQLLVEIVTTVLLLLGLRWLPIRLEQLRAFSRASRWRMRVRRGLDLAVAATAGLSVSALTLAVMTRPAPDPISSFFLERSYADAGGRNVINVLLVDFRAFDTLGEITVLGAVALTVFALLRRFRPARETVAAPPQQRRQNDYDERHAERNVGQTLRDYLMVPRVLMQWSFPVIAVLAVYLFMRGHDLPGGGFAAGVTMSIAFVIQYMASGTRWTEARLRVQPIIWIGAGLLTAVAAGAGSWIFGYPFLTSYFSYIDIPGLGPAPAATAMIFDLGVFALVVGATVLMLIVLAHQSIRTPRHVLPDRAGAEADALPAPEPASDAPQAGGQS